MGMVGGIAPAIRGALSINTAIGLLLLALTGCGADLNAGPGAADSPVLLATDGTPDAEGLRQLLQAELDRLGIDADKEPSAAPSTGNEVFDLRATPVDPDGPGGEPPTGVQLSWTERHVGDYNQDGMAGVADLTPLGVNYLASVAYDGALDHGGIAHWPSGNPDDDGDAGAGEPPAADSGAANWRLARTDGISDGEINVHDITPIAVHWNERLDGYRIYRKGPEDDQYSLLPDPENAQQSLLVARDTTFPEGQSAPDPLRPLRYGWLDEFSVDGEYQYYVTPYDSQDEQEGPVSNPASTEFQPPPVQLVASLVAAPLSGTAPLTVYFNAGGSGIPEGALPNYEWDWHGDEIYDLDSGTDFAVRYIYTSGGERTVSVRVTDNLGGHDTAYVTIAVNDPPDVMLEADVLSGDTPLTVSFDASASSDADGTIERWEWDLDGDRVFELDTPDQATAAYVYDTIGSHFPAVRITDDQGATATAELTITTGGWWTTTLAHDGDFGRYLSLAVINGNPAVVYYQHGDRPDQMMWYIRALDSAGRVWGEPLVVDGDGIEPPPESSPEQRGPDCCLAEVAGAPAIAYYDNHDFIGQRQLYIRATDAEGTAWGEPQGLSVLLDGRIGDNASLAIINGKPAIACNSNADVGGGRILCYFRSLDEYGDSWVVSAWEEVDRAKIIEDVQLTAMGDDTLIPVITYIAFDVTLEPYGYAGGVRIARAMDIDGITWDTPQEIVSYDGSAESEVIDGLSLVKLGDLPAIAFAGQLAAAEGCFLYYMASDSPYGLSWPDPPLAISPELASHVAHSSITLIDGVPAVALAAYHRYSLEYTRAEDAAGDAWPEDLDLVDDGVGIKVPCQLLQVDGRPAICYFDYNDTDLKYAIYY